MTGAARAGEPRPFGYLAQAAREPAAVTEFATSLADPTVSVVVPAYNHARYLPELLSAVSRELERAHGELVIVDNGSDDDTRRVILQHAATHELAGRLVWLSPNRGRARARNIGVLHARAPIIAFLDSDCVPAPGWLRPAIEVFGDPAVGVVQGPTRPHPEQAQPLFSHFIHIEQFDGTFSTCNVLYRRAAVHGVGGLDPTLDYWEDVDLGWRVVRAGWLPAFAPQAVVFHQVIPLSPAAWLRWPVHFWPMAAKVRAYPEYRKFLFLGYWVDSIHALFSLAIVSLLVSLAGKRSAMVLALPYAVGFVRRRGLKGRAPVLKVAVHLAWDCTSFVVLLTSSLRHRALVL